jgi:thiol:disulfide interchange protein DsbD
MAQKTPEVTKWNLRVEKIDATSVDLIAEVDIIPGWYIYSQFLAPDEGPIPTSFEFVDGAKLLSKKEGGNKHEAFDPIFEMHLVKFSGKAIFTSRVKMPAGATTLKGSYTFMTCDETKCLPPIEQKFTVALN